LRFEEELDAEVRNKMTPRDKLVYVKDGAGLDEAKRLMNKHRLERVMVVNDAFDLRGLITVKDIQKSTAHPFACKDDQGKLRVGAAVGVGADNDERIELLVAAGVDVLVVDDWAMAPLGDLERRDFLEICEDRYQIRSIILTSQLPVAQWHAQIGDPTLADSILDRLVHNAHRIEMQGESMRKKRGGKEG